MNWESINSPSNADTHHHRRGSELPSTTSKVLKGLRLLVVTDSVAAAWLVRPLAHPDQICIILARCNALLFRPADLFSLAELCSSGNQFGRTAASEWKRIHGVQAWSLHIALLSAPSPFKEVPLPCPTSSSGIQVVP